MLLRVCILPHDELQAAINECPKFPKDRNLLSFVKSQHFFSTCNVTKRTVLWDTRVFLR
jgi:hypothetical protein